MKKNLTMFKEYLLKEFLPFRFPAMLLLSSIFLIVEYVEPVVLFEVGVLKFTSVQILALVPPIVFIIYLKVLEYCGFGESEDY